MGKLGKWLLGFSWPTYLIAGLASFGIAFYTGWTVKGWQCTASSQSQTQKNIVKGDRAAESYEKDRQRAGNAHTGRQKEIRVIYRDRPAVPVTCAPPDAVGGLLDDAIQDANRATASEPEGAVPAPVEKP